MAPRGEHPAKKRGHRYDTVRHFTYQANTGYSIQQQQQPPSACFSRIRELGFRLLPAVYPDLHHHHPLVRTISIQRGAAMDDQSSQDVQLRVKHLYVCQGTSALTSFLPAPPLSWPSLFDLRGARVRIWSCNSGENNARPQERAIGSVILITGSGDVRKKA